MVKTSFDLSVLSYIVSSKYFERGHAAGSVAMSGPTT